MTNKSVAETIFKYIKSIHFKPYDIEYGNGYFIFEMGEESVVHFKIRGLYGWKFAMWICIDENQESKTLKFLTQHKDNIDKFKPSCSLFLADYDLTEVTNPAPYQWYQIREFLLQIKRHPFLSYHFDQQESYEYFERSFFLGYIKSKLKLLSNKKKYKGFTVFSK